MNVEHVNTAIVIEGVIQHPITNDCPVNNSDRAMTRYDLTMNKFSAFLFLMRDLIQRA
jgi:hypothetical protein